MKCFQRPLLSLVAIVSLSNMVATVSAQDPSPPAPSNVPLETDSETQPPEEQPQARLHFETGESYYSTGAYEEALIEFNRSLELSGRAALHYNIAQCHERLGNFQEARDHLQTYLDSDATISNRSNLELRVRNLDTRIAEQQASEPVEPNPVEPDPVEPEPVTPDPVVTPPPARVEEGGFPTLSIVGFGIAGVGIVGAAVFGALALSLDGELDMDCVPGDVAEECKQENIDDLRTLALVFDVFAGVALAGIAIGFVGLVLGNDDASEPGVAGIAPWVSPDGGGATLRARF